ncbi:MAG TPA: TauD/TfdA family dioxygenase, partial [Candidatus Limnocylindria bacterium]|nr:TauD/TfdA family dioxygenase [Candidatus Limnocylindria bacterium]
MIRWQNEADTEALPLVATPDREGTLPGTLVGWAQARRSEWEPRLHRHGALLFRGFGFDAFPAFEAFAQCFSPPLVRYTGGASNRKVVHGNVYTSTEASPALVISQHHEGAYLP